VAREDTFTNSVSGAAAYEAGRSAGYDTYDGPTAAELRGDAHREKVALFVRGLLEAKTTEELVDFVIEVVGYDDLETVFSDELDSQFRDDGEI